MSYRGDAFQRAKQRNRAARRGGGAPPGVAVLLNSEVRAIREDAVLLQESTRSVQLDNDTVIVSAGGVLPNDFLRSIGVDVETKHGTALGVTGTARPPRPEPAEKTRVRSA